MSRVTIRSCTKPICCLAFCSVFVFSLATRGQVSGTATYQLTKISVNALDDTARLASYSFTVDEGPQFHMGTISITGLPNGLTKHLLKEWRIKPGEVFDQTYTAKFLKDKAAPAIYQRGSRVWNSTVKMQPDPSTQRVNVQIAFN